MGDLWFVTGGARSGKSGFAQRLAAGTGRAVVYIATMEPLDDELRRRVARHRAERPPHWETVEAPLDPTGALRETDSRACALVDCLSLWVSNRLLAAGDAPAEGTPADVALAGGGEDALAHEVEALLTAVAERAGETIVVSNEVGGGVVPDSTLGRAYRDLLGRVNQQVAAEAARAWLLVAGRALELPPGG